MDWNTPGFPGHHELLELAQTHVHQVSDSIQPSHPLLSPSLPTFNLSQHQGLFQWVSSLHQVAKVLEFQYFVFWMLSFKPVFSLSSFTFIKRLFSSSSLSVIKVVSFAYLRLLIFLPAILIPACDSSSLAFHMVYSAYKLNKQGDNIQPWHTPFPIGNQSVPCPVLIVASLPAYRFLKRQVRWSGMPISWRIFNSLLWFTQSKSLA